ncbi:MAG TPA: glycosyltransferase family 4 protein [Candidatus Syntrophosphaera thermopropionivorans]|nr:glycosyltransferase family 4 protein [Candidatus Syntrophosphaera thermopropionivorans]
MENKPIKVLHIDSEKLWRGGQQQAVYLYEGMQKRGIPCSFVCQPQSKLEQYFQNHNLDYKSIPFSGEMDLMAGFRLSKFVRKHNYTILICHSAHSLSWGLIAKAFYPALKIIGVRRVDFPLKQNPFSRWKYTNSKVNKIVAVSQKIKEVLRKDGVSEDKIKVIYSGIDYNKYAQAEEDTNFRKHFNIPPEAILVGTIAAFAGHKDYPTFLNAAALALKNRPDLYFLAVGKGELQKSMQELAKELNIADKVIFTGFQQEVEKILKTLDIFVLASKKEGLGTSILEAMSAGIPVIGTASGGIPELIKDGENGLLVPPSNPEKLKDAILKLANSSELRMQLAERGKTEAQKFDKEIMVSQYIKLIQEL